MDAMKFAAKADLEARTLRLMIRSLIVSITGQPVNEGAWDKLWTECQEQARIDCKAETPDLAEFL
jgi:hypothetical protein